MREDQKPNIGGRVRGAKTVLSEQQTLFSDCVALATRPPMLLRAYRGHQTAILMSLLALMLVRPDKAVRARNGASKPQETKPTLDPCVCIASPGP